MLKKNLVIGVLSTALCATSVSTGVLVYDKMSVREEASHGKYTQEYIDEVAGMAGENASGKSKNWDIIGSDSGAADTFRVIYTAYGENLKRTPNSKGTGTYCFGRLPDNLSKEKACPDASSKGVSEVPVGGLESAVSANEFHVLSNVRAIGERAFEGCEIGSLVFDEIYIDETGARYKKFDRMIFSDYAFSGLKTKEITLPDNINYLGGYMFRHVDGLEKVRLGKITKYFNYDEQININALAGMDESVVVEVPDDEYTVQVIKFLEESNTVSCKLKYL